MGSFWSFLELAAHSWNCSIYSGLPIFFWVQPRWSTADLTSQEGKVRDIPLIQPHRGLRPAESCVSE